MEKAQCVFQSLTSLLISSGQIVQHQVLIYFYGGGSPSDASEDELETLNQE